MNQAAHDESELLRRIDALAARVAELERERERAQAMLRESEDRFQQLAQNVPGVIYLCLHDERYTMLYLNDAVEQLTGYPPRRFLDDEMSFTELYHPDDAAKLAPAVDAAVAQRKPFELEYRLRHRDGTWRWVHEVGAGVFRDDELVMLEGYLTDRTAYVEADLALRQRESLITHLPGVIYRCACDEHWTMLFISDQIEQVSGYEAAQFINNAQRTFASIIHEDDGGRMGQVVREAVRRRGSFDLEYRIRHRDGSIRWIYEKGQGLFDAAGRLLHLEGALFDITDRKRVEQDLDRFFELSPEMLCIAGLDGYFKRINPAFERTLGWSIKQLMQRPFVDFVHDDDRQDTLEQIERLSGGQSVFSFENRYLTRDGQVRWLNWHALPVMDEGLIYATARDNTDAKAAEQRVEKLQSELAHVSRLTTMGELATNLAHEVNQPLYAVCNYVQGCILRLEDGRLEQDELIEMLRRVAREAERAGRIVKHMRDFLRKRPPDPRPANINQVLGDLKVLIEPDARRHKVQLVYDLSPDAPPVCIDRIQIEQVIVNLVRNAVEAIAEADSPTRRVTLSTGGDGNGAVVVAVRDTGPGVSREAAEHLFTAFHTTRPQGIGMGLSISRSIIESHHGRLDHVSGADGGATFQFRLPASESQPPT